MSDTLKHNFQSAKADVGDATLVRPSNWNAEHTLGIVLLNNSGSQQLVNTVCVLDPSTDDAFTTTSVSGDKRPVVIVTTTINAGATGIVKSSGHVVVKVQNAVARGDLLRTSATPGALEKATNEEYTVGYATTAFAGPGNGTVEAYMWGQTSVSLTGSLQMWGSTSTPFGWLLCDGTAVSRATYSDLFALVGTSFGVGDGSTTFNLPNFKSRMAIGLDAGDANMDTIGEQGGSKTKTISTPNLPSHTHTTPNHTHTTPAHSHNTTISTADGVGSIHPATAAASDNAPFSTATDGGGTTGTAAPTTDATGSGTAFDVLNPFMAVNFVIKY
jgi:microcystin-dependent protein